MSDKLQLVADLRKRTTDLTRITPIRRVATDPVASV